MRKMKDSGVEWIGAIPETWKLNKISSLYEERNTKVSDTDYRPLSVTKQGIVLQLESAAKSDNGENRKLIKLNDFVINSRSDRRGSCGISEYDGSCSLINIVLKPRGNMNNLYYNHVFKTETFADEFYKWGNGIVDDLWSTKWSNMKRIYIMNPSLDEQNRIADFLDRKCAQIDAIITKQQAVIERLKLYKQSVITEAVTKGLDPNVPMKDSGVEWIGKIPAHWKIGQLKFFISIRSGVTLGKKYPIDTKLYEYPYLRVANVQVDHTDLLDVATIQVSLEDADKYRLYAKELLMTEGGDRDKLGRGCVWNGEIPHCLHQNHIFAVSTNAKKLDVYYLDYVTTSDVARNYFDCTAKKTTNLASTNSTTILQFRLPIPPVNEQKEIMNNLNEKCGKINIILIQKQALIDKLTQYKKSLIYEAVTGKLEV